MKLLIVSQKIDINDDVLGFFHAWIREFAKRCERVTVICLYKGEYDLPENVKVFSLGKEQFKNPILEQSDSISNFGAKRLNFQFFTRIKYIARFYNLIWQERHNFDHVFVHMNQVYAVLGGLYWRLAGKRIALWYTHKSVPFLLRVAEKFVNIIFTASSESFRHSSKKVKVVGHGIDVGRFSDCTNAEDDDIFKLVYVGRISRIKNQRLLIESLAEIKDREILNKISIDLIGPVGRGKDADYKAKLKEIIQANNLEKNVNFIGPVPYNKIARYYKQMDLAINLCPTGGMDKTVLEAMACGVPIIALNQTFKKYLATHDLILSADDPKELVRKILNVYNYNPEQRKSIGAKFQAKVKKDHDLVGFINKIINEIK